MRPRRLPGLIWCALLVAGPALAENGRSHRVLEDLDRDFPSIASRSSATFSASGDGLVARLGGATPFERGNRLQVLYPRTYDAPIVASFGSQRVALRAAGAAPAHAVERDGTLIYEDAFPAIDVIQIPIDGRSEELLLVRERRDRIVIEFEIVSIDGVASVQLHDGGVRFLPIAGRQGSAAFRAPGSLRIEKPWVVDAAGHRSETAARWTLEGDAPIPSRLRLTVDSRELSFPIVIDPTFYGGGNLNFRRYAHTATLLGDGSVLVAGGEDVDQGGVTRSLRSAEIYDPVSEEFHATQNLSTWRSDHTATLLLDGRVLIVGGLQRGTGNTSAVRSAELYDPRTGTFTPTGSLLQARAQHTATLLPNGKVLIAGGSPTGLETWGDTEIYDPATGSFTFGGTITPRMQHTATLLPNGKVLIAGGASSLGSLPLATADLYDVATNAVTAAGSMANARRRHVAVLLADGKVLVTGGYGTASDFSPWPTAEVFDPASGANGSFASASVFYGARASHTITLLPDDRVLLIGGGGFPQVTNPVSGTSETISNQPLDTQYSAGQTATLLPDGRVLAIGGRRTDLAFQDAPLASTWIFEPTLTGTFTTRGGTVYRENHTATLLPSGKVLLAGGYDVTSGFLSTAQLYDPATGLTSPTGSLAQVRAQHTATLLPDGRVLIAGGENGLESEQGYLDSAEIYNPSTGLFSSTGNLVARRSGQTATLLQNGKVLLTGGYGYVAGYLPSAEIFDPATGTFTATGSLYTGRRFHTATLLPNGRVLVAGGAGPAPLASVEVFDPQLQLFLSSPGLTTARRGHTATLLTNGDILIAGGFNASNLASTEVYATASGFFLPGAPLAEARSGHTATLLPDGNVLLLGGAGASNTILASAEIYGRTTLPAPNYARAYHTATPLLTGEILIAGGYNGAMAWTPETLAVGSAPSATRRPAITSAPVSFAFPGTLTVLGTQFRGAFEAASSTTAASATNFPILHLQRLDNEQIFVVGATSFSDLSWAAPVAALPVGAYRMTVRVDGIPSLQKLVRVLRPAPVIDTVAPDRGLTGGGTVVTISGSNLQGVNVVIGGNLAVPTSATSSTVTFVTPAHAPAAVAVTATAPFGISSTAPNAYLYLANPPVNVTATRLTDTSIRIGWAPAYPGSTFEVLRSAYRDSFTVVGTTANSTFDDTTASPNTAYLYAVHSINPLSADSAPDLITTVAFTEAAAAGAPVKAVHVSDLRAAVTSVCALAGTTVGSFTDPVLASGMPIRASHVAQLRGALDSALGQLLLPPILYSRPLPLPGSRPVYATDINELLVTMGGVLPESPIP